MSNAKSPMPKVVLVVALALSSLGVGTFTFARSSRSQVTGATAADPYNWKGIAAELNNPDAIWTLCAKQNRFCAFNGTMMVRYGVSGKYAYKLLTNGTACTNKVFGNPYPGRTKYCSYRVWDLQPASAPVTAAPAPTTTAAPALTPTTAAPAPTTLAPAPTAPATTLPPATTTTTTPAAPTFSGRPFGTNSPWNTPTPTGTRWYDSVRLHTMPVAVNGDTFQHWWVNTSSVGVYYSKPTDPVWTFALPDYIAPLWNRNRPAQTFQVRAPANMVDGGDEDHILVVVDGNRYYEVWNALVDPATRRVTNRASAPGWATGDFVSGPGAGTISNNDGVRAANFSWAGGLITGRDLANGRIDHALVVALPYSMLKAGSTPDYVWPATAWDNGGAVGPIKMGSRLGIPAGTPRPGGLSPLGNQMFDALITYGAFVGDYCGGPWPMFYADKHTVTETQMLPLFTWWNYGGSSDMEKLGPLLRVADYQP